MNGSPRVLDLLRDAVEAARSQRAATTVTALLVAVVCFVVLVTTGQAAVAEQQVVARIDGTGTRLVTLVDATGTAGIRAEAVAETEELSDVAWAFGLGPANDVVNASLPREDARVPARAVVGDLPPDLVLVAGRAPLPGEAVAGRDAARALGTDDGVGTVVPADATASGVRVDDARAVPVVGTFDASGPLAALDGTVLVATEPAGLVLSFVHVLADDASVVPRLGAALEAAPPAAAPDEVTVETAAGAVELRAVVAGDLGASARRTMALVMAVGCVVVAVTVLGAVSARRRDFGRRRALGATRSALVAGVLVQTACGAVCGVALGTVAGLVVVLRVVGAVPHVPFVVGVAGLTLLVALLGAVPSAALAAFRDPVRILRVP
ncbi:FtsX-like permease family protein [Cellulosimicrobium sp. SH8]|uniref:FtsX-like permease family protein n=1 Tax=Cellulosimicrobium sp. SH8 TaxID=2952936 RepID=UPI0021F2B325|nr:FtsX-like permease family protein [Cellulosimicrobium sp. SH8]